LSDDVENILDAAIAQHRSSDVEGAVRLYQRAITLEPERVEVKYYLGTALLQLGRFDDCIECFEAVLSLRPDSPDAHNNLGVAHQALGNWERAAKSFQEAIKTNPRYDQAFFNLGALMEDRGLFADAEKCFRHAAELKPEDITARSRLAGALKSQQKWAEAEPLYRELASGRPDDCDLQINLAYVLARREQLDEAANVYQNVLRIKPDFYQVHNSLSYIYERQGRLTEAEAAARRAIALEPGYAEGHNNLGNVHRSSHRLDEACTCFEQAQKFDPDFALAAFNLGTTKLLGGCYREGWSGYARHAESLENHAREFHEPRWQGESMQGKTLLVFADQGFGDTIQFSRFLRRTKDVSDAKLLFECPNELFELFGDLCLSGYDELIAEGTPLSSFDAQVPLAALPHALDAGADALVVDAPYIRAPSAMRGDLQQTLDAIGNDRIKVGLVWQGNPNQSRDVVRSCPLETLRPLFDVEGATWLSLQTGEPGCQQLNHIEATRRPIDIGTLLHSFAETAAVISRLDLVITVDTATSHLAGALGHPTWTLLCHTPDWRWLLGRNDSPWYPSMRLFRQNVWGDWDSVVASVRAELESLVRGTAVRRSADRGDRS